MWMAQRGRAGQRPQQKMAQVGGVTQGQIPVAVYVDGERRNLPLYSAGGYYWRPSVGQKVLVIKTEGGDCVAGSLQEDNTLGAGEVKITGGSGGGIYLTAQGGVALSGDISVNGEPLEEMVARLILENMPSVEGVE